jgi:hypothetical protein
VIIKQNDFLWVIVVSLSLICADFIPGDHSNTTSGLIPQGEASNGGRNRAAARHSKKPCEIRFGGSG